MNIVEAEIQDLPSILAIRTKTFSVYASQSYSKKEVDTLIKDVDEEHFRQMIEDKKIFIMKDGETIIGSAGWNKSYIRHVYVDPERTRQGIASRLLAHAEKDYRRRTGENHIFAGVTLYARNFYEANDYKFVSEEIAWDGSNYLMMKKMFALLEHT